MKLKKEPLEIDFIVESRPMTIEEELAVSEFIKANKAKRTSRPKPEPKKVDRKSHERNHTKR